MTSIFWDMEVKTTENLSGVGGLGAVRLWIRPLIDGERGSDVLGAPDINMAVYPRTVVEVGFYGEPVELDS